MPPPVSDLTSHIGFWLRMVSNHVSHTFATKLADADVTVAEWCLLRSLYGKEPTSPSQIAEDMGMTRGAITKLANRLLAKSLILRAPSQSDGRAQTLALTKAGSALVPKLAALADQNDAEFFGSLTAEERATLISILETLAERANLTAMPLD